MTVPIDMIAVPRRMAFLRPSLSPIVKAITAPKKQPISYIAVTVARRLVLVGPTRL